MESWKKRKQSVFEKLSEKFQLTKNKRILIPLFLKLKSASKFLTEIKMSNL